jgi:hypothetical protein
LISQVESQNNTTGDYLTAKTLLSLITTNSSLLSDSRRSSHFQMGSGVFLFDYSTVKMLARSRWLRHYFPDLYQHEASKLVGDSVYMKNRTLAQQYEEKQRKWELTEISAAAAADDENNNNKNDHQEEKKKQKKDKKAMRLKKLAYSRAFPRMFSLLSFFLFLLSLFSFFFLRCSSYPLLFCVCLFSSAVVRQLVDATFASLPANLVPASPSTMMGTHFLSSTVWVRSLSFLFSSFFTFPFLLLIQLLNLRRRTYAIRSQNVAVAALLEHRILSVLAFAAHLHRHFLSPNSKNTSVPLPFPELVALAIRMCEQSGENANHWFV